MKDLLVRNRGYLPHLEMRGSIYFVYFVTLRLADTLPHQLLQQMRMEVLRLKRNFVDGKLNALEEQRLKYLQTKRVQSYLDNGSGAFWLKQPEIAEIVQEAVRHHEAEDYATHVCCIMPNHIHWILTPQRKKGMTRVDSRVIPILQRFKSYTAHAANKLLQRTGSFWGREYYDHLIRSSEQFDRLVRYTLENPVKARLCKKWSEWPWTVCSETIRESFSSEI